MYFDVIAKIVSERTGCDVSAVKPESTFSELGIDSLDTVELLMNLDVDTVTCLHCGETSYFKRFENIATRMEDALENWLITSVALDQQDDVRRFFRDFCQKRLNGADGRPPQITYKARSTDDSVRQYTGVFIKVDESVSFYCCRETKETADSVELKAENDRLKGKIRDLVMRFSDGIAAFEVTPDALVKPLHATENVRDFFGYNEGEWLLLTERFTPVESFVAYSEVDYEDFAELFALLVDRKGGYVTSEEAITFPAKRNIHSFSKAVT